MTIQSIDTYYRGHLFRSRLEARWAAVFDDLGIRWEYEPQGYRVGENRRPYLPDFYLTDLGWWIEVKGASDRLDISLLVDAVHPTHGLGRTDPWYFTNILILGPIPECENAFPLHYSIRQSAAIGQLRSGCQASCVFTSPLFGLHHFLPADYVISSNGPEGQDKSRELDTLRRWGALVMSAGRAQSARPEGDLTRALLMPMKRRSHHLEAAYLRGRTARFEHGEVA